MVAIKTEYVKKLKNALKIPKQCKSKLAIELIPCPVEEQKKSIHCQPVLSRLERKYTQNPGAECKVQCFKSPWSALCGIRYSVDSKSHS